jgi:ABC-2 type transport system permease protein
VTTPASRARPPLAPLGGFWPLFKRELFAFFVTPLAWILLSVFLVVQGLHFAILVDHFTNAGDAAGGSPVQAFFGDTVLPYLVVFLLVPPMTMRLFAEERRSGTIEPLMTAPVSTIALVLAKYGAALAMYVTMWAPTALYIVILRRSGEIDTKVVLASYLGLFLVGSGYLAVGLMMSATTKSQFVALVLTSLVILGLFIAGLGEFVFPDGTPLQEASAYLSVWGQMNEFARGVVDSRRLVFDATLALLPLFVTVRTVDAWRWE